MAIGMYFTPQGFTRDKYDDAISKLADAGASSPAGRTFHVALESDGQIQVFDIWESEEAFQAFGETLLPILGSIGVDPGQPGVSQVHNVLSG